MKNNINVINKLNPNWVKGFVDTEGCFFIKLEKNLNNKFNKYIGLIIAISEHLRDQLLIKYFLIVFFKFQF